ncbi:MAG: FAD-dependent oxidoreductase, partial [Spirochaetes bacterium]|nr:FAD-dependent oxidoreductase [Spirochaetota bacterium]
MKECDIAIIGAGVVGLAIAHKVCNKYSVIVIEAEDSFGKHTSSRNSETIHSGIYYPADTLKAKLCLRGNELLYQYARDNDISFLNCGKYIIASDDSEVSEIHRLFENGNRNGVPNLRLADGKEIEKTEPMVKCLLGVHVPTAGIINSHEFMKSLETKAKEKGALFAYRSKVERIIPENKNYSVITDNGELK